MRDCVHIVVSSAVVFGSDTAVVSTPAKCFALLLFRLFDKVFCAVVVSAPTKCFALSLFRLRQSVIHYCCFGSDKVF